MRCVVSCESTPFPWLVFFFGALLRGSMIHKHRGRWMWQGNAWVVSWNWEKYSCHSKLVSTLSMLNVIRHLLVVYEQLNQFLTTASQLYRHWKAVLLKELMAIWVQKNHDLALWTMVVTRRFAAECIFVCEQWNQFLTTDVRERDVTTSLFVNSETSF